MRSCGGGLFLSPQKGLTGTCHRGEDFVGEDLQVPVGEDFVGKDLPVPVGEDSP